MGSKNPKLRGKSGGTKSKDMPKGNAKGAKQFVRVAQAVASGGKSEVTRAVKRAMKSKGGSPREMYKHGGKHNDRIMYAGGGDVLKPN